MPCIYIIRNTVNSKVYIGQTKNTAKYRFRKHKGMAYTNKCSALYSAFRKYGTKNFYVETIVEGNFDVNILNQLEKKYIKEYNSLSPNGYNLTTGGDNYEYCDETSIKKSKALKGRIVTWNNEISEGVRNLWKDTEYRNRQINQRHQKRGKYRTGIVRLNKRKKVDIESFRIDYRDYLSLGDISNKYNISINTIYKIIKRENIEKRGYECNNKKG